MRVLKTHAALIVLPVVVLPVVVPFPAVALLVPGPIIRRLLLRWLAVPVAIGWAAFLSRRSARAAVRRQEPRGPEIFARTRTVTAEPLRPEAGDAAATATAARGRRADSLRVACGILRTSCAIPSHRARGFAFL